MKHLIWVVCAAVVLAVGATAVDVVQVYRTPDGFQYFDWEATADNTGTATAVTAMPLYGDMKVSYFASDDYDESATIKWYTASPFDSSVYHTTEIATASVTANTGDLAVITESPTTMMGSPVRISITGMGANAKARIMSVIAPRSSD